HKRQDDEQSNEQGAFEHVLSLSELLVRRSTRCCVSGATQIYFAFKIIYTPNWVSTVQSMAEILKLRCSLCEREYTPDQVQYTCPVCGQVGTLDVLYNYAALRQSLDRDAYGSRTEPSMWRYRE